MQGSIADFDRVPTIDEKIQLSHDIFKIHNQEVARVLSMIEAACPHAISRKLSADEVLINFDAMTPRVFHEINQFVTKCIISNTGSKKNQSNNSSGTMSGKNNKRKSISPTSELLET